jgi:hypothetical protein
VSIQRGDAPPRLRAMPLGTLAPPDVWADLRAGAWRPNQVAAAVCAQLGMDAPRATDRIGPAARRSTADLIGAMIDAETSGHVPTRNGAALAERVAAALPEGARVVVVAPEDGGGLGSDNEAFLGWLALAVPGRVEVAVSGARPALPGHWVVDWGGGKPAADRPLPELPDDAWARAHVARSAGLPCAADELLGLAWRALADGAYELSLGLAGTAAQHAADPVAGGRARAVVAGMRIGMQDFAPLVREPDPDPALPPRLRGFLVQSKGWGLVLTGHPDAAAPLLEEAGRLLAGDPPSREYLYHRNIAALVHMRRGELDEALRLEEEIAGALERLEPPDWQLTYVNRLNRARLHLRRRELNRAGELFALAFETCRGVWTLGDQLARHSYAARVASARGDLDGERRHRLAAALWWASDPLPEAVPIRAARMVLGAGAPRHRLAAEISHALGEQLAAAFGADLPDAGEPPTLLRAADAPALLRGGATAIGCADWTVAAADAELPAGYDGAEHRRLRTLIHGLLAVREPIASLRRARVLLVDDQLGQGMPGTAAETVASCLRLGIGRAWFDGELVLDASSDRDALERALRPQWGPAVAERRLDGPAPEIRFRRYRPPRPLDAAEVRLVSEPGGDPRRLRGLERDRVLTLSLPDDAAEPVAARMPSAREARVFAERGYVRLEPFAAVEEIAALAGYVDRAIERGARRPAARVGSGAGLRGDRRRGELVWLPRPEDHAPELASCFAVRRARRFAAALLGVDEADVAATPRIFFKPARVGTPVPWHQDDAYRPPGTSVRSLNVWIPLDEATPESGCLHFVPGSHRDGLRTHRPYQFDPTGMTLEASPEPGEEVTACALSVGAASAHHCRTLHSSTPNRSERSRRALVVVCEVPGAPLA